MIVHIWPSGPLYPPAATCCGQWCSRNKSITGTLGRKGCDHIGHRPYRPQPYRPQLDDIGHSKKPYRPHRKSISATQPYRPKPYRPQRYRPQNMFIWRHRDDTSRFRVVHMVNLNVNEACNVSHITAKNKYLNVKKCRFQFRPTYRLI